MAELKQALGQGMDLGLPEALDLEGRAAARLARHTRGQRDAYQSMHTPERLLVSRLHAPGRPPVR